MLRSENLELEDGDPRAVSPMPARSLRILFLTASLVSGGAERQIVALARGLRDRGHHVALAVFYRGGCFEEPLRADGFTLHDLGRRGRWDLRFWPRLARLVGRERPDAVLAYLGGPNIFAALLKIVHPRVKIVWGVRSAMNDLRAYDWLTRISPRVHAAVSVLSDAVVANSQAARRQAIAEGISGRKILVIPNGIDCESFRPDVAGRERVRREWGITEGMPLVGMVARLDPVKNHASFLEAAARVVAASGRDVRFVCVGTGDERYRRKLEELASALGLTGRLTWTGERAVTRALYSALDVAVLSSDSESFPNVVAEAMACGTPVVVTDTGDMPLIVGDTGVVVPPRDPEALARGILQSLSGVAERGRIRGRIEREFSVERLVTRTERALERILSGDAVHRA